MASSVFQINVKPNTLGEVGLPKISIDSGEISLSGIEGDYNRFRFNKKNNDPDMAIMLISKDILEELNNEGWPVKPGDLGENLTLANIDYRTIKPGQHYTAGQAELEVSIICDPCSNLNVLPYIGKNKVSTFIKTLMKRRGWYARVIKEGLVSSGDPFLLI